VLKQLHVVNKWN